MSPDPADDRSLITMQLRLECIAINTAGRLVRIPGPDPDDLDRVYAYRTAAGTVLYLRHDLPEDIASAIAGLGAETVFRDEAAVAAYLPGAGTPNRWRTYRFVTTPDPVTCPDAVLLTEEHRDLMRAYHPEMALGLHPTYVTLARLGDRLAMVAACVSVRENDEAGECYVYTLPDARRQGYGRQAVAAWGAGMLARGKVPFYSHLLANTASAGVARSLGLAFAFEGVVYG